MLPANVAKLYNFADSATGTVDGVFGLIVGMLSGYIGATLGCKTQLAMEGSMLLRNVVLYFVILMGVNSGSSTHQHPYTLMVKSFAVWAVLMMFNRMRPISTGIVVALFVILYMVKSLREYNIQECEDCGLKVEAGIPVSTQEIIKKVQRESMEETLHTAERGLMLGIIANVVVGSYLYLGDKKKEYGPEFDWMKFVLGVQKCKSLQ